MTRPWVDSSGARNGQPSLRLVLSVSVAACIALGTLRGFSQYGSPIGVARVVTQILPVTIAIALFWAPASLAMARAWQPFQTHRGNVAARLIALSALLVAEPAWMALVVRGRAVPVSYPWRFLNRLESNVIFCIALYSAFWAAETYRRVARSRLSLARNEAAAAESELHVLTMQLQPHFLFNTLNLISQLVYDDIAAALRTLAHLKQLLARSLRHASTNGVPLRDELQMTSAFLDIQHARFHERLRIVLSSTDDVLDASIPPLILQPLVENAIRHGIGGREAGGTIEVIASRTGERVSLRVIDDGKGFAAVGQREGLGLANTRSRLDQFFGGDFTLVLSSPSKGRTIVALGFPLRPYRPGNTAERDHEHRAEDAVDDTPTRTSPVLRIPWPVRVGVIWLVIAVIWTQLDAFQVGGNSNSIRWGPLFVNNVINVLAWLFVTPIPVFAAQRLISASILARRRVGEQLLLTAAGSTAHLASWALVLHEINPAEYARSAGFPAITLTLDASVYLAILMISAALALTLRRQETRVALLQSERRLKVARIAALRIHLEPSVLFGGLDAIARSARRSPRECEFAISRMADLLRAVLANTEREFVSLSEEMQVLDAFADVMGWPTDVGMTRGQNDLARAAIPPLLLTALAAASHAELTSVVVGRENDSLVIELTMRHDSIGAGTVDQVELALITDSLQPLFGHRYRLESRATPAESQMRLQLPYTSLDIDDAVA